MSKFNKLFDNHGCLKEAWAGQATFEGITIIGDHKNNIDMIGVTLDRVLGDDTTLREAKEAVRAILKDKGVKVDKGVAFEIEFGETSSD